MGYRKGYRKPARYLFIPPAQVKRLVAAADGVGSLAIRLSFYLGLRLGEVADLHRKDFDLDNGKVWVRTLKRVKRRRGGKRVPYWQRGQEDRPALQVRVPQSPAARKTVEEALHLTKGHQSGYVFISRIPGQPASTEKIAAAFRAARRKARLPEGYTFHGIRHCHAVLAAALTRNPLVVRDQLRHVSVASTDHYMRAAWDYSKDLGRGMDLEKKDPPTASS